VSVEGWTDRVDLLVDRTEELDAEAVLLRPDGYVVCSSGGQKVLDEVLRTWFGSPTADADRTLGLPGSHV
jgi:hypothetical protein